MLFRNSSPHHQNFYHIKLLLATVNSEIFAMVLYSQNFVSAKFRENKILAKWLNYTVVYLYR